MKSKKSGSGESIIEIAEVGYYVTSDVKKRL